MTSVQPDKLSRLNHDHNESNNDCQSKLRSQSLTKAKKENAINFPIVLCFPERENDIQFLDTRARVRKKCDAKINQMFLRRERDRISPLSPFFASR